MDDRTLFRYAPDYAADPASRRSSTGPRIPGRSAGCWRGRDVQQQRHLPEVRRGRDVPELPRHPRRGAPDARTRQHAAARAHRAARARRAGRRTRGRRHEAVRVVQGVPPRVPDRRRHGADEDRGAGGARDRHGVALRERLVAELPRYAPCRRGSRRWRTCATGSACAAGERVGFAPGAACRAGARGRSATRGRLRRDGDVLLFADTFNRYFEPENLRAAVRVLRAAGLRVGCCRRRGAPLCCGRTYLAAGMVDRARAEARRTLRRWPATLPVVGLEPSCLLTLRDEFARCCRAPRRGAGRPRDAVRRVPGAARAAAGLAPMPGTAHVHGHCHQKAFGAFPRRSPRCGGCRG